MPSSLITDTIAHHVMIRPAAHLMIVLVLALMLEAAGSPVHVDAKPDSRGAAGQHKGRDRDETCAWSYGRVSLDGRNVLSAKPSPGAPAPAQPEKRTVVEAKVRGHLKRQWHGAGGAERKWVWIEGYPARRWVAPDSRVRVS